MRTITFYSYKGGVGRTLTLANVAANLRLQGHNVVAVDFDLEAPGLYYKLNRDSQRPLPLVKQGLIDILFDFVEGRPLPPRLDDHVLEVRAAEGTKGWIKLLPAGTAPLADYWRKLARIDWHQLFYSEDALGVPLFLELKERIAEEYAPDYLLIDSRTGITEMGGICTAVLPEQVVCLMLKNQEHLDGSRAVLRGILSVPRIEEGDPVEITPVLARFPPDLSMAVREQEVTRVKGFLNEPAGDVAQTLRVKDLLILRSDPSIEMDERIVLEDEASVGQELAEDYLALYWKIVPPEQRPRLREGGAPFDQPVVASEPTVEPLLRLVEIADARPDRHSVEMTLEGAGPRLTSTSTFTLSLTGQDREDIRWYLEDHLLFPLAPAPAIAARVEARMAEIGEELCRGLLGNRDAARLWEHAREYLAEIRVEVITRDRDAGAIPWELMRDPTGEILLAVHARSFVRGYRMPAKFPRSAPDTSGGPVRILLVISRPWAGKDYPFRSVARHILGSIDHASRENVTLDVLRPPTFEMLGRVLRAARARGKPYHIVHFDGHGIYADVTKARFVDGPWGSSPAVLGAERYGAHGYLVFESADETAQERGQLADGPSLGALLVETGVPILVLNACRSAHVDPPPVPEKAGDGEATSDTHDDVASFGSLALEVMDKGVSGVVAMRYNVYLVTAAQFVADLYGGLADGLALGEAVTLGRRRLHARPQREIGFGPVPLQDWCVPVVYATEAIPLFPTPASSRGIKLVVGGDKAGGERGSMVGVPAAPDVGFFGRDETLLALDRAFDKHGVVLLYAYAGSGKSSAAAEFARWYSTTGGVEGPVLWTSFERRMALPQVLDGLGRVFEPVLAQNKIQWLALSDEERRGVALQILKQTPVLWIWDNVEPVAGFPAGTASAWTVEEQTELVDFLREARGTRVKFLLTSRRDEQAWLGALPARIAVPAMPMQERVQLARALADKRGATLDKVGDWRPLLAFTQGNPLAITVLVGQALRDGIRSKEQVEAFVAKLRAGEAAFEDEASEGRSRSLGASLSYGFGSAFGEEDKKRLALLHLFQGFVDVDALKGMGNPEADWCLPEVRGLTREAGVALLDRAVEIGLLSACGGGYYSIHPAVPWFFRGMFAKYYPAAPGAGASDATSAMRAYVAVMGDLGDFYHNRYGEGHRDHLTILEAEESNLLHAWYLARCHEWSGGVISAMQGLFILYEHTGRRAEWARLVAEVQDDFVDLETDGPLPGHEKPWAFVNQYRVRLTQQARQWAEAERLLQAAVRWARDEAAAALALPVEALDSAQRNKIRTLAVSLEGVGHIQLERGQATCINSYVEAAEMAKHAGDRVGEATAAFNLGHAHMLPTVRDLAEAERWFRRSLDMRPEEQRHGRAKCLGELGLIAYERFKEAHTSKQPEKDFLEHLNAAVRFYHEALDLLPSDAVDDLAVTHTALGVVYGAAGNLDRALQHYQDALRCREKQGNLYGAAQARLMVAGDLANAGRLADARAYALAALRTFETYGDRATEMIQKTRDLLAQIDSLLTIRPT